MVKTRLKTIPAKTATAPARPPVSATANLPRDIPWDDLLESAENPNEQDEKTFDRLVEGMREDGMDEFPIVVPQLESHEETGKYIIVSGHHRAKAFHVAFPDAPVPCVIREGWDDDKRKIQLVARNMIKGNMNPEKFSTLYNDLAKKYDKELLKSLMGFTKKDAFAKVYKQVTESLPASQRKKLEDAKESIKSVDDLSSVLNRIFKDGGSELSCNYMVFSFGGKEHHYFKVDNETNQKLKALEQTIKETGQDANEVFKRLLDDFNKGTGQAPRPRVKLKPTK